MGAGEERRVNRRTTGGGVYMAVQQTDAKPSCEKGICPALLPIPAPDQHVLKVFEPISKIRREIRHGFPKLITHNV